MVIHFGSKLGLVIF